MLKTNRGSVLTLSIVVTAALAFMFLFTAQNFNLWSKRSTYLAGMNAAYSLAETGLADAIRQLRYEPDPAMFDTTESTRTTGAFQNRVFIRNSPVPGVYYVITSATATISGHHYATVLHSYVRVSNTANFFLAINNQLTVSHPVDVEQGLIYASTITFITDGIPGTRTLVENAFFRLACYQRVEGTSVNTLCADGLASDIVIGGTPGRQPTQIPQGLVFPQLLDRDMGYYLNLAGAHTTQKRFDGDIFPPGYTGNPLGDVNNRHHVYFYDGDIEIRGTVHGQVLFVASGNIYIYGNLRKATESGFPGEDDPSGSRAHQAVLIAGGSVILRSSMTVTPPTPVTQTIEALIIAPNAPNGEFKAASYGDDRKHSLLSLNFVGSIIISAFGTSPSVPEIFRVSRTYSYDDSFRTTPPPYLPSVALTYHSVEDAIGEVPGT